MLLLLLLLLLLLGGVERLKAVKIFVDNDRIDKKSDFDGQQNVSSEMSALSRKKSNRK